MISRERLVQRLPAFANTVKNTGSLLVDSGSRYRWQYLLQPSNIHRCYVYRRTTSPKYHRRAGGYLHITVLAISQSLNKAENTAQERIGLLLVLSNCEYGGPQSHQASVENHHSAFLDKLDHNGAECRSRNRANKTYSQNQNRGALLNSYVLGAKSAPLNNRRALLDVQPWRNSYEDYFGNMG